MSYELTSCKVFADNYESWAGRSTHDWFIQGETKVQVLENGVILPIKSEANFSAWSGGVTDNLGNFIAGHIRTRRESDETGQVDKGYNLSDKPKIIEEKVVYCGVAHPHFGHFLTESLGRLWWFLENPDPNIKYAFIAPNDEIKYLDFLMMLGLKKEQITLIKEPTCFSEVIIPEQSTIAYDGFKDKAMKIYDAIRDSVEPKTFDKVYLTRTALPKNFSDGITVNEDYFEAFYRSQGYEIISPEKYSIREQVAIMAGAKEVACVYGTAGHLILFSHDHVKITVLNRFSEGFAIQFWMNQARRAKSVWVDISMNFLPHTHFLSCYLLLPTVQWEEYLKSDGIKLPWDSSLNLKESVFEYIEEWTRLVALFAKKHPKFLETRYRSFTFSNFVEVFSKLIREPINSETKKSLENIFKKNK